MAVERTLVILKPDAIRKGVQAEILDRYMRIGLNLIETYNGYIDSKQAEDLYKTHRGKPYFEGLVLGMTSGPIKACVLEGENALQKVRKLNGATNPREAMPGTIRYDFMSAGGPFNTVHGSDSIDEAKREIAIIFSQIKNPIDPICRTGGDYE